ncbi:MAG: LysM peptidoglycan-binding domain-containing protein [Planctomycetia bacterium]|nr:LysM peptidoglycan-binding domain-containing protein [Planctomycetia bacterium]
MPNDAKLGLVVGVGLVIAIGVVFYKKDASPAPGTPATGAAVQSAGANPGRGQYRPTRGRVASRYTPEAEREHVVVEGDTLTGLAERYYGDGDRDESIRQANAETLAQSDALTPGMVLRIPEP